MTKDEHIALRLAEGSPETMELDAVRQRRWDSYIRAMDRELREHLLKVTMVKT